jgi:AraC-like DNA-binding protein
MKIGSGITVVDHASVHGKWTLLRKRPTARLLPFVHELQGYAEKGGRPVVRRELPSVAIPLIIDFMPGFSIKEGEAWRHLGSSFAAGLHERATVVGSAGRAFCMQVDLSPLGARRLLGVPLDGLAGRVVELDAVLGAWSDRLAERLHDAPSWTRRFELLEGALLERVASAPSPGRLVAAAWDRIATSGGTLGIAELARSLDCSRKHLNELFRREVGLPAKTVARLVRFEGAVAALASGKVVSLAGLAAECGYYDQSHLNRDFLDFAGECPTRLLRRMLPDGTGLMDEW